MTFFLTSLLRNLQGNLSNNRKPRGFQFNHVESLEDRRLMTTVTEWGIDDQPISQIGEVSGTDGKIRGHASATNEVTGEYLVVWVADDQDIDGIAPGETEVYGQLVSNKGVIRSHFRISDAGGTGNHSGIARSPDVVWNAARNEYLVVWQGVDPDSTGNHSELEIFGQRLNHRGEEIGTNDFRISDAGNAGDEDPRVYSPSVTWNEVTEDYLVAWSVHDPDTHAPFQTEIVGQRLDADGTEIGVNDFPISQLADGAFSVHLESDIAVNRRTGEYLVSWVALNNNGDQLEGQMLDANGAEIGTNNFRISNGDGSDVLNPSMAFNSQENEFFVTWAGGNRDVGLAGGETEIFGQFVSATGQRESDDDLLISKAGDLGNYRWSANAPSVAWNSSQNEYMVVWHATTPGSDDVGIRRSQIFAQRISADGQEKGSDDFRISKAGTTVLDAVAPNVVWTGNVNEYLVTWRATQSTDNHEIVGQRLDVQEAIPLDLSALLNADGVANRSNGIDDPSNDHFGDLILTTESYAQAAFTDGHGLPDDGFFPANEFHPDIQLNYHNDDDGLNSLMVETGDSVTIDARGGYFDSVHLAIFNTTVIGFQVDINYVNGTTTSYNQGIENWNRPLAVKEGPDRYTLAKNVVVSGPKGPFQPDYSHLVGIRFDTNPSLEIRSISVHPAGPTGRFHILGATGMGYLPEDLVVTTSDDLANGDYSADDLSLREALHRVGRNYQTSDQVTFDGSLHHDTITMNYGDTYNFSEMKIMGSADIIGPGADTLTISGDNASRIFYLPGNDAVVTMSGLTLTDATTVGSGGAIGSNARLVLDDIAIRNSSANFGGGIYNSHNGNLSIRNSEISDNHSDSGGGGIFSSGRLIVSNTTISGNESNGQGAGLFQQMDRAFVHTSTITDNHSDLDGDANLDELMSGLGAGIYARGEGDSTLENTIVAGNHSGLVGQVLDDDIAGNIKTTSRFNLIGTSRGAGVALEGSNGNLVGSLDSPIDPRLGPLADNGGSTRTHALLPDSPAIDAGADNVFSIGFDQRGEPFSRIVDGDNDGNSRIDMGAVERVFEEERLAGDANGDGVFDSSDLIQVFQRGEYEDNIAENSVWEDGDWTGDLEFDSSDLIAAFQHGQYVNG